MLNAAKTNQSMRNVATISTAKNRAHIHTIGRSGFKTIQDILVFTSTSKSQSMIVKIQTMKVWFKQTKPVHLTRSTKKRSTVSRNFTILELKSKSSE